MEMAQRDVVDDVDEEDEDDGYTPPVPVRVEARLDRCPACDKPMTDHGALELLRCAETIEDNDEEEGDDEPNGHTYGHTWAPAGTLPPPPTSTSGRPSFGPPSPPRTEYERWQKELKGRFPEAPAPSPPESEPEEPNPHAPAAGRPHILDPDWTPTAPDAVGEEFDVTAPIEQIDYIAPLPPVSITTADGVLDLEQLAKAMRNVVLRERDDVIKRGGPLERQNLELKERLADQIEQTQLWRQRAQASTTRANSLQGQYDNLVKENRKKRSQQQRSGEGAKAVREIKEIIKIVQKLDGWTVKMQGNGHYRFEKDGVFVTDAASSGGSQQVNMATIVKLRRAGVKL